MNGLRLFESKTRRVKLSGFTEIITNCSLHITHYTLKSREWRNWQTHHLEGVAPTKHGGLSPPSRTNVAEKWRNKHFAFYLLRKQNKINLKSYNLKKLISQLLFFFLFGGFGTFAPFSLASESPIAIACFLLFTVFPERPLLSVPSFIL